VYGQRGTPHLAFGAGDRNCLSARWIAWLVLHHKRLTGATNRNRVTLEPGCGSAQIGAKNVIDFW
jgi:hypothetical protein